MQIVKRKVGKEWEDCFEPTWSVFDTIFNWPPTPSFTMTATAGAANGITYPTLRSSVDAGEIKLTMDAPGARKDDLSIEFDTDRSVTIRYTHCETGTSVYGRYSLDPSWDKETASASLADGILTITMKERAPPAKQGRKVEVK